MIRQPNKSLIPLNWFTTIHSPRLGLLIIGVDFFLVIISSNLI